MTALQSTTRLVSSHDQKEELVRQVQVLEAFSATNRWQFETIQDLVRWLKLPKKRTAKIAKTHYAR